MSWQWPTSGGTGNQGRSKPNADIPTSVGGLLHSLPSPDPLHAPGDGGQGAGGVWPPIWRCPVPHHPSTLLGL